MAHLSRDLSVLDQWDMCRPTATLLWRTAGTCVLQALCAVHLLGSRGGWVHSLWQNK